jgi:hypothetical protein
MGVPARETQHAGAAKAKPKPKKKAKKTPAKTAVAGRAAGAVVAARH